MAVLPGPYPASAHPYASGADQTQTYTSAGADHLNVIFDALTEVESGYDFLYLYDAGDNLIRKASGTDLAGKTVSVPGDTVKVRLTSDGSIQKWGYGITEINDGAWAYPESSHNYWTSTDEKRTYVLVGASHLNVTFDILTTVESGADFLYLYDAADAPVGRGVFTGQELAGQTITVQGNTLKIRLTSDSSTQKWGYKVTAVNTDPVTASDFAVDKLAWIATGEAGLTWYLPPYPANGNLYAILYEDDMPPPNNTGKHGGVYKSTNDGATWALLDSADVPLIYSASAAAVLVGSLLHVFHPTISAGNCVVSESIWDFTSELWTQSAQPLANSPATSPANTVVWGAQLLSSGVYRVLVGWYDGTEHFGYMDKTGGVWAAPVQVTTGGIVPTPKHRAVVAGDTFHWLYNGAGWNRNYVRLNADGTLGTAQLAFVAPGGTEDYGEGLYYADTDEVLLPATFRLEYTKLVRVTPSVGGGQVVTCETPRAAATADTVDAATTGQAVVAYSGGLLYFFSVYRLVLPLRHQMRVQRWTGGAWQAEEILFDLISSDIPALKPVVDGVDYVVESLALERVGSTDEWRGIQGLEAVSAYNAKQYCDYAFYIHFTLGAPAPVPPTLTITKVLVPGDDPGLFNLRLDGGVEATDVGDGGTTGAITTTAAAHTVSETAGTGTDLADYDTVIGGDAASDGTITLANGDAKTATITNTRKATPPPPPPPAVPTSVDCEFYCTKHPSDAVDYRIDWAPWLGSDRITAVAWSAGAGLTVGSESHSGTLTGVRLTGGVAGTNYHLVCRIDTQLGRRMLKTSMVRVRDCSTAGDEPGPTPQSRRFPIQ